MFFLGYRVINTRIYTRILVHTSANARLFSSYLPPRGDFSVLTDKDLSHFERIVGRTAVCTTGIDAYNTDWMKHYKG